MEQRTRARVEPAERNRDLARWLLTLPSPSSQQPSVDEWIAVIAFYAAVHDVKAYRWEQAHVEPGDHGERSRYVLTDIVPRQCRAAYGRLRDEGFKARSTRGYRLTRQRAQGLVNRNLADVEATVMAGL